MSPSQWFGGNEQCDPNDRSGGLDAACAKESLATHERSSKRLVCMEMTPIKLGFVAITWKRSLLSSPSKILVLPRTRRPFDRHSTGSTHQHWALGPSTGANPPQFPQASAPRLRRLRRRPRQPCKKQNGPQYVGQSAIGTNAGIEATDVAQGI